jgi:hypothetical protein
MAVDQMDVVDFVSESADGVCNLTVSDHLEWEGNDEHVLVLQDKLNRYLAFVESGELPQRFPNMAGKRVVIDVRFMYPPSQFGLEFLKRAKQCIEGAGFGFEYKLFRTSIN